LDRIIKRSLFKGKLFAGAAQLIEKYQIKSLYWVSTKKETQLKTLSLHRRRVKFQSLAQSLKGQRVVKSSYYFDLNNGNKSRLLDIPKLM
jgi:hypothetical protein